MIYERQIAHIVQIFVVPLLVAHHRIDTASEVEVGQQAERRHHTHRSIAIGIELRHIEHTRVRRGGKAWRCEDGGVGVAEAGVVGIDSLERVAHREPPILPVARVVLPLHLRTHPRAAMVIPLLQGVELGILVAVAPVNTDYRGCEATSVCGVLQLVERRVLELHAPGHEAVGIVCRGVVGLVVTIYV